MSRWLHGPTEGEGVGPLVRVLLGVGAVGLLIIWWAIPSRRRRPRAERLSVGRPKGVRLRSVGNLLLALGALLLVLAGVIYYVQMYGPGMVLPRPVALAGGGDSVFLETSPTPTETPTAVPTALPTSTVHPTRTPTATPAPTPTVTPTPFPPGRPARLTIPSIGVDSWVQEAGTYWENGQLYYQTVPYAVAHYKMTARAGEIGNAVFSGHVTSRSAGNVFADLYKVKLGDEVHIFTDQHEFVYVVTAVKEVLPTDVGVVAPTPDATATLITCSGEWIPAKREFDHRLIVSAKLKN